MPSPFGFVEVSAVLFSTSAIAISELTVLCSCLSFDAAAAFEPPNAFTLDALLNAFYELLKIADHPGTTTIRFECVEDL